MVSVFRVENNKGTGMCIADLCEVYRHLHPDCICPGFKWSSIAEQNLGPKATIDDLFDERERLRNLVRDEKYHFAFRTLERLTAWFPEETGRSKMQAAGAVLLEYDVPPESTIYSDLRQCIFDRSVSRVVAAWDLVTLKRLPREGKENVGDHADDRPSGRGSIPDTGNSRLASSSIS